MSSRSKLFSSVTYSTSSSWVDAPFHSNMSMRGTALRVTFEWTLMLSDSKQWQRRQQSHWHAHSAADTDQISLFHSLLSVFCQLHLLSIRCRHDICTENSKLMFSAARYMNRHLRQRMNEVHVPHSSQCCIKAKTIRAANLVLVK